jgi:hypothetical protein
MLRTSLQARLEKETVKTININTYEIARRPTHNQRVLGSNPSGPTIQKKLSDI